MSNTITWTDEQLQQFITQFDTMPSEERRKIIVIDTLGDPPLFHRRMILRYQEQDILLSFPQIPMFLRWMEKKFSPAKEKHCLDNYTPGTGKHVDCWFEEGVIIEAEDILGRIVCHTRLEPAQALQLLAWLSANKDELERAQKHNGA